MLDRIQVLALSVARSNYREGTALAQFIYEWERYVRQAGGPITIEDWPEPRKRTGYRRLATFRVVFPELGEDGTPQDLMRPLLDRLVAEADRATEAFRHGEVPT
jgi:hypothetical protein